MQATENIIGRRVYAITGNFTGYVVDAGTHGHGVLALDGYRWVRVQVPEDQREKRGTDTMVFPRESVLVLK